jgi:N4-gp56 family major capsid protein
VANEYTSVATSGSLADALVKTAYDLAVGHELRVIPNARQFVTVRPKNPSMTGSSTVMTKYADYSEATVTAAKTPLTEESSPESVKAPAPSTVTLTPAEYGFVNIRTQKLDLRSFADVDPEIARGLAFHMSRVIDELVQDTFITGTNKMWLGSNTAESTYVAGDVLKAHNLRQIKARFDAAGVEPWFGDGGLYAAYVHPFVVLDLREETGSGGWRVPNEYGVDQSKIWAGEIGAFEGFRFVQNSHVRWRKSGSGSGGTQVRVHENYFFGRGAIAEDVRLEPQTVLGPVVDPLLRFRTIGWKGDLGWAVYENKALWRVISSSSENQQLV